MSWQRTENKGKLEQYVLGRPVVSAIIPTSKWGNRWGRWPVPFTSFRMQPQNRIGSIRVVTATAAGSISTSRHPAPSLGCSCGRQPAAGGRKWAWAPIPASRCPKRGRGLWNAAPLSREGRDPLEEKRREAEPTFGECADRYIDSIKSQWRNAKHEYQWNQTLTTYCKAIRSKRVSQVKTEDILAVLNPIWLTKSETASRTRGRIERVLDFAKSKGWRSGENPAAWRGHLKNILPKRQKLTRGHLAAMPYEKVPAFLVRVRAAEAMAARALEFAILTVGRSGEILGARWSEIDLDKRLWTLPKDRMKAGAAHTVPLPTQAIALIEATA